MYPNVTSTEIDILSAETAASLSTQHPDYARLAARLMVTQNHKATPETFAEAVRILYEDGTGFIDPNLVNLVQRRGQEIDARIVHERDWDMTYFGFKTLERSYLLKTNGKENILERPQYLMMRVALGIHCVSATDERSEDERLEAAFETYDLMSSGYFTHASPTLFHSGTTHPQLSSCFLVQMSDVIHGIYDNFKRCAISKSAGGIGLSVPTSSPEQPLKERVVSRMDSYPCYVYSMLRVVTSIRVAASDQGPLPFTLNLGMQTSLTF
jgi:ribonucleotide reductase alpha subunit